MSKSIRETRWFKIVSNKYIWVLLFFIVWMLFLDNYSWLQHRGLNQQIEELEDNKRYYLEQIKKDKHNIYLLQNPDQVEKYAREKYYMKRANEDIYLIEFEGDSLKNE